ncbi:MAG: guanine deaminase [Boseongicola sp.]
MTEKTLLIGQTLRFQSDPFQDGPDTAIHDARGGILIEAGHIADVGTADELRRANPDADVVDHGDALIFPGFIDAHAHYPQTAMIASWGKRLIDWLNSYTFPEEMRFGDPDYAAETARRYFDLTLSHGTTTVASYCTIHPASVDAYFGEAEKRGLCAIGGKTCMDRNAPERLCDTAQSAYDDSKALLERWHGKERLIYAVTPRFSPTSTREQLQALGALWAEHPDCPMQTHLSEQTDEVAWVKELFPEARDYLDTYEVAGLVGPGALFGHAIYLTDREKAQISDSGSALVHCPTSNTFIGSGLFDLDGLKNAGQSVALATDTGGGSSFSMLRTIAAAYEIAQLRGRALHPAELMWLATEGSAQALRIADRVGALRPGLAADLVVIDLASTPAIAQRAARADTIWEAVFPTIMMGDDRAIKEVLIMGKPVA